MFTVYIEGLFYFYRVGSPIYFGCFSVNLGFFLDRNFRCVSRGNLSLNLILHSLWQSKMLFRGIVHTCLTSY